MVDEEVKGGCFSSAGTIQNKVTVEDSDIPADCYYCDQQFSGKDKPIYEKHIIQKHPGKPGYPGISDIQYYKLIAKGMNWEK